MTVAKLIFFLTFFSCWIAPVPSIASARVTTLFQSVEQALKFSPQLQAVAHYHDAAEYDLKKARARYRPSVDLMLGYGLEQHSDSVTRLPEADPSDSDWDSRGDASLRLTQNVWDGGETRHQVSIQKALLDSADFDVLESTQSIALDAINAHLEVYLQRELVALAENDLEVHQDIYRGLSEIERAGTGNIADVTQTRARLARARSILIISKGDLDSAVANYERVTGTKPGTVAFADVPDTMPISLKEALTWTEEKNPGLLAINASLKEAEARVGLARSAYKPKLNVELSSRYYDQLDGDPSWQHTNDAMLVLRWNLFNGGQDREAANAALSRKYQRRSTRDDRLIELKESTAAAWAEYLSLKSQKTAYREAVASSEKTFDAYLQQYSVSRRSLLDVLNAEKEYFQSARQLVSVIVREILTAYRILNLGGSLQVVEHPGDPDTAAELSRLSQAIGFPDAAQSTPFQPRSQAFTAIDTTPSDRPDAATEKDPFAMQEEAATTSSADRDTLFSIAIGPCTNERLVEQVSEMLHNRGLEARQTPGTGTVRFTRLLEGVYFPEAAYARLEAVKQVADAFVLPEAGKLAIYVGSFQNHEAAIRHAQVLAGKNIAVTPVAAQMERQGTMLVVRRVDRETAESISRQVSRIGLSATVTGPDFIED